MSKLFKDPLVIYHDKCTDGFCSAYIAKLAMPHAKFHAANYGERPPEVVGKDVILIDFSYPRKLLLLLKERANSLLVLDHHKTAEEDLAGLDFCIFDNSRSGATLARDFFFPGTEAPHPSQHWLINYVEDKDLWNWNLPDSKAVSAALSSYSMDFDTWDVIWATKSLKDLVDEGSAILSSHTQVAIKAVGAAQEISFQGHKVLITNCNSLHNDVADFLSTGRAFGVVWQQQKDGRYKYSLRSKKDGGEDVSKIAKLYGGGGHKTAAGFISNSIIHVSLLGV